MHTNLRDAVKIPIIGNLPVFVSVLLLSVFHLLLSLTPRTGMYRPNTNLLNLKINMDESLFILQKATRSHEKVQTETSKSIFTSMLVDRVRNWYSSENKSDLYLLFFFGDGRQLNCYLCTADAERMSYTSRSSCVFLVFF
jgi:hypothetical protein